MGILDEAIREHLDLKRKHGAAEDDVQRLEDEAFGPPTRPGEPDFPDAESDGETPADLPDVEQAAGEEEMGFEELLDAEEEAEVAEEPVDAATAADATAVYDETTAEELDLDELDLELDEEEIAPAEAQDDELTELDELDDDEPEDAGTAVPEAEEGDEDVLADTPEFLRDKPEDDELWFEQGRPKDFDFDEE